MNQVEQILIRTGGLCECERGDGGIYDPLDSSGVEDAIKLGHKLIEAGELDGTKEAWENKIRNAMNDYGMECPNCP
jgi:hypothetical protein